MSLLTLIEKVTDRIGITKPTQVIGNTDKQIAQLLELANEEGEDLAARKRWTSMVRENVFTLTAARDQGLVNGTVVTDSDFDYYINDTFMDRTTSLRIVGPSDSREWQRLRAFPVTGPYLRHRFWGRHLYIDPVPSADTAAFEYVSTSWCETSVGVGQSAWAADDDVGILPESLMVLGVRWRWLKTKGLEYSEDFATYEARVADAMTRDGGARVVSLESRSGEYESGIVIPIGSWSV